MKEQIKCYRCDKTFPKTPKGIMAYRLHKEDHRIGKEVNKIAKKPDIILDIHKDKPVVEKPAKVKPVIKPDVPKIVPVKPEPIKLTYKYVGNCPTCGSEVDTLEVDLDKFVIIAYCQSCHKQLRHKPVAKL